MTTDRKSLPIQLQEARAKKQKYQEFISKSNYKTGAARQERNARTHALCQIGGVLSAVLNKQPAEIDAELLSRALHRYCIKTRDNTISVGEYIRLLYSDLEARNK